MCTVLGSKMGYINLKPAPTKSTEAISDYGGSVGRLHGFSQFKKMIRDAWTARKQVGSRRYGQIHGAKLKKMVTGGLGKFR